MLYNINQKACAHFAPQTAGSGANVMTMTAHWTKCPENLFKKAYEVLPGKFHTYTFHYNLVLITNCSALPKDVCSFCMKFYQVSTVLEHYNPLLITNCS